MCNILELPQVIISIRMIVAMFILFTFAIPEQRDAFEYIYTNYKALMLRRAQTILRDPMLAEDAVSEAFIRIYKNIHKIDDPASNRSIAFVMTILKNTALTMLSKERAQYTDFETDFESQKDMADTFDLEQHVLSAVSNERIYELLGSVGEELRSVFLLKYAYDLPHKKIGEMLGISENNVTVRLHRAKKKIASLLEKEGFLIEK